MSTPKHKFSESSKRSLFKSITFRILVITSDWIIIFTITHRTDVTLGLVVFSNLASTLLYYLHERIWNKIHWGRNHKH